MSKHSTAARKLTAPALRRMKAKGERIVMLTAYDATFARLLAAAGADILLVGDSLGMVVQGQDNTLPVTVDEMIYHCRAVARGVARAQGAAQIVCDMPFMSYQLSPEQALQVAGRMVQEGGAEAVKLEGGARFAPTVRRIAEASIPVMGHIGLTPQSVHQMGGFKVQGRNPEAAEAILQDALALEAAGAYALVLEGIPKELAEDITAAVAIPTIGIGAGAGCDGQVLVCYDLLGMDDDFTPKFVRRYAELCELIPAAVRAYAADVRTGQFPAENESFSSPKLRAPRMAEPPLKLVEAH